MTAKYPILILVSIAIASVSVLVYAACKDAAAKSPQAHPCKATECSQEKQKSNSTTPGDYYIRPILVSQA
jgi:hypothetical protein